MSATTACSLNDELGFKRTACRKKKSQHKNKRHRRVYTYRVGGRPLHNAAIPSPRTIFTKASCTYDKNLFNHIEQLDFTPST